MRTIAKWIGFIEGFLFALIAFMAAIGGASAWYGVNWKAVNKSVEENSDIYG